MSTGLLIGLFLAALFFILGWAVSNVGLKRNKKSDK